MKLKTKGTPRVLIIDDEPVIARVCQRVLIEQGFSVDIAEDGAKAIDKIFRHSYSLCILDLRMPGINGFQVCQYLTDNHLELSHHIIITTGDTTSNQVAEFLRGPERTFLEKPFTPGELIAAVETTLN